MRTSIKPKHFALSAFASIALSACGGGTSDNVQETINGPGGIWFGSFVETEKTTNSNDIDIGGMYLDIPKDISGSVKGYMSYQTQKCQDSNSLKISGVKARETLEGLTAKGNVDPLASANNVLDDASRLVGMTLKGDYLDGSADPKPWGGSYDVQNTDKDKTRYSEGCAKSYTFAPEGKWRAYPADAQVGITLNYNADSNVLSWNNLTSAKQTLIMHVNTDKISLSESAFIAQEVMSSNLTTYAPSTAKKGKNTFVVQVFSDAGLIGFDTLEVTL